MGKFLTPLRGEKISERSWKLTEPLVYQSNTVGLIIVDAGFVTNFASVPRLPFMYWFFGGIGDEAATLHDWLYRKDHTQSNGHERTIDRPTADRVLQGVIVECMTRDGDSHIKAAITAAAMWAGVRIGGAGHWE